MTFLSNIGYKYQVIFMWNKIYVKCISTSKENQGKSGEMSFTLNESDVKWPLRRNKISGVIMRLWERRFLKLKASSETGERITETMNGRNWVAKFK